MEKKRKMFIIKTISILVSIFVILYGVLMVFNAWVALGYSLDTQEFRNAIVLKRIFSCLFAVLTSACFIVGGIGTLRSKKWGFYIVCTTLLLWITPGLLFKSITPRTNPEQPKVQQFLIGGDIFYHQKNYQQAISYYQKAIELDPNSAESYGRRGFVYYMQGNMDRAISDYSKAIQINPNDKNAYHFRGLAYTDKGNYDQAISDFTKSIELEPYACIQAYENRAAAYAKKGNYDQAISDYNKVIKINPNLAYIYYYRGVAYDAKGDHDQAISDYNKAWIYLPKAESLGFFKADPDFLDKLKKASGREK